jgi:hypothetical protein
VVQGERPARRGAALAGGGRQRGGLGAAPARLESRPRAARARVAAGAGTMAAPWPADSESGPGSCGHVQLELDWPSPCPPPVRVLLRRSGPGCAAGRPSIIRVTAIQSQRPGRRPGPEPRLPSARPGPARIAIAIRVGPGPVPGPMAHPPPHDQRHAIPPAPPPRSTPSSPHPCPLSPPGPARPAGSRLPWSSADRATARHPPLCPPRGWPRRRAGRLEGRGWAAAGGWEGAW